MVERIQLAVIGYYGQFDDGEPADGSDCRDACRTTSWTRNRMPLEALEARL